MKNKAIYFQDKSLCFCKSLFIYSNYIRAVHQK